MGGPSQWCFCVWGYGELTAAASVSSDKLLKFLKTGRQDWMIIRGVKVDDLTFNPGFSSWDKKCQKQHFKTKIKFQF